MSESKHTPQGRRGSFATRRAIVGLLKTAGPQDAAALGEELGVTAMAARQHLATLSAQGYVTSSDHIAGRGRPRRRWSLTERAAEFFPDRHDELVAGMLESVRAVFGASGMEQLLEQRRAYQLREYQQRLEGKKTLGARIKTLAEARTEEGYMAEARPQPDGTWHLVENHCAICTAAKACQGFCTNELEVFHQVLGPGAQVERIEHLLSGQRRCVYSVVPVHR